MKSFRFSLGGLEKVRQAQVDSARLALAASETARGAQEEEIMSLNRSIDETTNASQRDGVLDVDELLVEERFSGAQRRKRDEQLRRLADMIARVEKDRERLTDARKEHRALERLRERRYLEFLQALLREEREQMDEAASVGNRRRRQAA